MAVNNDMFLKSRKKKKPTKKPSLYSTSKSFKRTDALKKVKQAESESESVQSDTEDDIKDCEEYEKKPRMQQIQRVRNLLPVKHKDSLVYRTEVLKDESEEETPEVFEPQLPKGNRSLSLVQRYAMQKTILGDIKRKVALLCTSLVEDPQSNLIALKELISMMINTRTQMIVSEKKVLCFSLLHVFSDILPSYKIRQKDDKDPKVKLKKETKKLLAYESNLLRYYKKYVEYLFKLVQDMKKMKNDGLSETQKKALHEIGVVAVKCLGELLSTRFSFNLFKNIANMVVPLVTEENDHISKIISESFEKMFKADKRGEASYELVGQIIKFVKEKKFCVPPCLLKSFQSLNLKEAKPEIPKIDMRKGRAEWRAMSRTQRRYKKKIKGLEAELKEAEANENVETLKKFHTLTLNKVFWLFFHVLKDGDKISLLTPALEGLAKFAYLINLEFFNDLNAVVCGLMESDKLNDIDKLHGVYTLFTILAGQAESLHIDPHNIYCHMYQGLLKLSHYTDVEHYILALKCLEFNILRKKKKISFSRILAFTKRISIASLQTPAHGTLALLSAVRNILLNVSGSDILLDSESSIGSGIYYPEMRDPEHCNARSTTLWELHLLRKHYNPFIKLYSLHLLNNCPNQGRFALPDALSRSSPEETLNLFSDVAVNNKMDFLEEAKEPPKKKFKSHMNTRDLTFEKDFDFNLSWNDVENVDFMSN